MNDEIRRLKSAFRESMRAQIKNISAGERAVASEQAAQRMSEQEVWKQARAVLLYAPLADELDLSALGELAIESGKLVALPRFASGSDGYVACQVNHLSNGLIRGRFGVLEPGCESAVLAGNQLDLVLVPGVAFDPDGRRLGRGRGFYDRLLQTVSGAKCGVAFDQQVRSGIPIEPHDIRLDYLVTPTHWFICRSA